MHRSGESLFERILVMKKATIVFYIATVVAALFIVWGLIPRIVLPNGNFDHVTESIQTFLAVKLGWFYLLSATAFIAFSIFLIFSKYGKIKLGKPDRKSVG